MWQATIAKTSFITKLQRLHVQLGTQCRQEKGLLLFRVFDKHFCMSCPES